MDNQLLSIRPKPGHGFVYCYTSPSGKVYIGQTKTTLQERLKQKAKGYKGCPYFYKAIQKYGIENFKLEILEEVPLSLLNEEERKNIFLYNSTDRNKGYNLADGQDSLIQSLNAIPVYQYNLEGKYITSFPSIAEAARQLRVHHTGIRKALNKKNKRSGDSYWRTERINKIEIDQNYNFQPHAKKIYMYSSKTGEFLEEYASVREAHRRTKISRPTIQSHISGEVKIGRDFTFRLNKVDNLYDESSTTIPKGVHLSRWKRN